MKYQVDLTHEQHFKLYNDFLNTMELNTISNYLNYIRQQYNATVLESKYCTEIDNPRYCLEFNNQKDYTWFLLQL
jgi:hypothetical protein